MANAKCRKCDRAADAGAYCSSCASDIMAKALNPSFCRRWKKSPRPERGASLSAVKLAMLSAPLGHGVQAARAAQHGAHCHGQYGSQGMTNPPGAARVGYLGQGFPQSQRNLYLPVLPSPDLRIPKNNLIVDPRLTTVQQLNDPAPSPPSRCPHAVHRCPSVD